MYSERIYKFTLQFIIQIMQVRYCFLCFAGLFCYIFFPDFLIASLHENFRFCSKTEYYWSEDWLQVQWGAFCKMQPVCTEISLLFLENLAKI